MPLVSNSKTRNQASKRRKDVEKHTHIVPRRAAPCRAAPRHACCTDTRALQRRNEARIIEWHSPDLLLEFKLPLLLVFRRLRIERKARVCMAVSVVCGLRQLLVRCFLLLLEFFFFLFKP
jgi:hypothetical protein